MPIGYSNNLIKNAIMEQLEELPFVHPESFSNLPARNLAKNNSFFFAKYIW